MIRKKRHDVFFRHQGKNPVFPPNIDPLDTIVHAKTGFQLNLLFKIVGSDELLKLIDDIVSPLKMA